MSTGAAVTAVILSLTIALLVLEWLPPGLVGILAALALAMTGVIPGDRIFQSLSHDGVVSVAAMFIVSAAVTRTGALSFLADFGVRHGRRKGAWLLLWLVLIAAFTSAWINNTSVVLVFLPIVLAMCERLDESPSRYLIPLSYAAILGGTTTLVGTSTNVVALAEAHDVVARVYGPGAHLDIGFFTFTPLGIAFVIVGTIYMVTIGRRLLPDRTALSMSLPREGSDDFVTEVEVEAGSGFVGRRVGEIFGAERKDLRLLQFVRADVVQMPLPDLEMHAGDVLILKGSQDAIMRLYVERSGLAPLGNDGDAQAAGRLRQVAFTLAELIVTPRSKWIGRRVDSIGIRGLFGVSVIAIQRHGRHIRRSVGEHEIELGDTLLVQGTPDGLRRLRSAEDVLLVEGVEKRVPLRSKAPIALVGLLAFVVAAAVTDSLAVPALATAAVLVLFRCVTFQDAVNALDWNVLLLLAGSLCLGAALQSTGLARDVAQWLAERTAGGPAWVTIGSLYLITLLVTEFLSNGTAAALMVPIAVEAAHHGNMRPEPFVLAVTFAASAAFAMPMGYQTHLFVYGSGGYRLRDYVAVGLPLDVLLAIVATALIPLLYGL